MAAQLKQDLGIEAVRVGDRKAAEEVAGRFPEPEAVVTAVRAAGS